jgi:hypothetical protein
MLGLSREGRVIAELCESGDDLTVPTAWSASERVVDVWGDDERRHPPAVPNGIVFAPGGPSGAQGRRLTPKGGRWGRGGQPTVTIVTAPDTTADSTLGRVAKHEAGPLV